MPFFPIPKTAGIFWIRREDWTDYMSLCTDRTRLPPTYEDWVKVTERVTNSLAQEGWEVVRVDVDLGEFAAWCKNHDLKPDKVARICYANEKAAAQISLRQTSKN